VPELEAVNYFQICIFVSDDTTPRLLRVNSFELWIAFKFVSLYRMTQLHNQLDQPSGRCELLSNLYLCIGWHSFAWRSW